VDSTKKGKPIKCIKVALGFGLLLVAVGSAAAQAPLSTAFTYQGQLKGAGVPSDGLHDIRFRLFDGPGVGAQVGPTLCLDGVNVVDGLFTVQLDFGATPFAGDARWLDIGVRADTVPNNCPNGTFTQLTPRQPLTATPFATFAMQAPWGGLLGVPAGFADGVDNAGSLTLPFSGSFAGSDQTAFSLTQTGLGSAARFSNTNAANYYETLSIGTNGSGAGLYATHSGTGYAAQFQNLNASNSLPVVLAMTSGGGACLYGNPTAGSNGIGVIGIGRGTGDGVRGSVDGTGNAIEGSVTGNNGRAGYFEVTSQFNGQNAVEIRNAGNDVGQALYALHTGLGDCGLFQISNSASTAEAVEAITNGTGDAVQAFNTGTGRAGFFQINNTANTANALYADTNGGGNAARFAITSTTSTNHTLYATTAGRGRAALFQNNNAANTNPTVQVSTNGSGPALLCTTSGTGLGLQVNGTARVDVLEITGADVAERFPTSDCRDAVQPGMVMEIDPTQPGKLRISRSAYNRRVAGVVSGAGDIPVGAVLGNLPSSSDGPPIALTGRVWVRCDARERIIEPGDLLTTSDTPGHAMKVLDHARSQGAIIGKAMTILDRETGLVLVLVGLQ
jgi:hypothetical protein